MGGVLFGGLYRSNSQAFTSKNQNKAQKRESNCYTKDTFRTNFKEISIISGGETPISVRRLYNERLTKQGFSTSKQPIQPQKAPNQTISATTRTNQAASISTIRSIKSKDSEISQRLEERFREIKPEPYHAVAGNPSKLSSCIRKSYDSTPTSKPYYNYLLIDIYTLIITIYITYIYIIYKYIYYFQYSYNSN